MTAEVNDRGAQFVEMPHRLVRSNNPLRAKVEFVAAFGHAELSLDRGTLFIERESAGAVWTSVLIAGDPQLRRMGPPAFAEALSRELQTSVVAFFIQTTASNERVEHWDNGRLVRELEFAGDSGGWIAQSGIPQQWESSLFFSEEESTAEGAPWPLNLREDISEDDIRR